jgi:hypothetical protein
MGILLQPCRISGDNACVDQDWILDRRFHDHNIPGQRAWPAKNRPMAVLNCKNVNIRRETIRIIELPTPAKRIRSPAPE